MGILFQSAARLIDADQFQHLPGLFVGLFLADILVMGPDGLCDLVAHRINGVQAGHGILEDHGTVLAAEVFHLFGCIICNIFTFEKDLALGNMAVAVQDLHDGIGGNGFA